MRSAKVRMAGKKRVQEEPDLIIERLMNPGEPENGEELSEGGETIDSFKRDFGIREWDWPQGVGLCGLLGIMQARKNEDYEESPHQWSKDNMREGPPSKNISATTPLLTLAEPNEYYHDQEFEVLCFEWVDWLMNCPSRTMERGFQHVTSVNGDRQGARLNEDEMRIDTISTTALFLNRMGQKYQNQSWTDESIHQVLTHIKYLWDEETGLFYYGRTFNGRNNLGSIFWRGGNGWFTLGMLDYTGMFKDTMNAGVEESVVDAYKAQVEVLKGLQSKSGLWYTMLTDGDSYEEVSGSVAITAGILKGIRYGILDDSYLSCTQKVMETILDSIDRDDTVLNVFDGTNMGYSANHYKNILIAPMAYGQSLTILALAEASLHLDWYLPDVSGKPY